MGRLRRLAVAFPFIAVCVGCDQVSKMWAEETLTGSASHEWLGGAVRVLYAQNPGAFLGLGAGLPEPVRAALLVGVAGALLAAILLVLVRSERVTPLALVAGALLLAGGLGNLLDRLFRDGLVVDFMNLGLGPVRTGIFNVADVQLMVGALLIAWLGFRGRLWATASGVSEGRLVGPGPHPDRVRPDTRG